MNTDFKTVGVQIYDEGISISVCTTCANRLYQLEQTFESNYLKILENSSTEWVIVNFGSTDNLDDFIISRLPSLSERVVYIRELSGRPWHMSVAKNIAHRLANGRMLFSLDCDNFINNSIDIVSATSADVLHLWSGTHCDGTHGRIAVKRDSFYKLGGYDESFLPMTGEDKDFLRRANAMGLVLEESRTSSDYSIKNSKEDSMQLCSDLGFSWEECRVRNLERSLSNIAKGNLVANLDARQKPMNVEIIRGGQSRICS